MRTNFTLKSFWNIIVLTIFLSGISNIAFAQIFPTNVYGKAVIGASPTSINGDLRVMPTGELYLGAQSPSGSQINTLTLTGNYTAQTGSKVYLSVTANTNANGTKGFVDISGFASSGGGSTTIVLDLFSGWDGSCIDLIRAATTGSDAAAFTMAETTAGSRTAILSSRVESSYRIWYIEEKILVGNISSPSAVCSSTNLSLTPPSVTGNGASQGWEIENAVGSDNYVAFNNPVVFADNGKKIRYAVMNSCGKVSSNAVAITVNDKPSVAALSTPQPICAGSNLTATANVTNNNGSAVTAYSWKLNGTAIGTSASLSYQVGFLDNGKTLILEVTNGCGTATTTGVTVTVKSTPAPIANNYIATCLRAGTETWISRIMATGTLKWYKNATDITETAAPTTFDKNVEQNVSYWVSQTIDGCESERTKVTVNISNALASAVVEDYSACAIDQEPITWKSRVQTTGTLQWYSDNADGTEISEPADFDPNVPQQISYWVVVEDAAGCRGLRTKVSVTVYALPTSTVQLINDVTCPNGNDGAVGLVSVNDGQAPFTYSWKNAEGTQVSTSAQANNLLANVYTLTVTDANFCSATSSSVTVIDTPDTVNPVISGTIAAQQAPDNNDCIFRIPDLRNLVRAISSDNCTTQSALNITQVPAIDMPITENTTVTVTVTDTSGNTAQTTVDVFLPTMPTITFQSIDPLCSNAAPVALNASNSGGFSGTFSSTGVTGTTFNPSIAGAGTHVITYRITPYGCEMTETQDVTVYPAPENIVIKVPNVCPEQTLIAEAIPSEYTHYDWTVNGVLDLEQTGSTYTYNKEKTPEEQITFSVMATTDKGCTSNTAIAISTVKTIPSIALTPQPIFCVAEYGTRIQWRDLVTAGEHRVQWYETKSLQTPIEPENIDQSVPGTYTLYAVAVSTNGCLSDAVPMEVSVTVNENPVLKNIDTSDLSNIRVTVSGGLRPYIYHIEGVSGNTDGLINLGFLPIGRHQLLVIDRNGCLLDTFVPILKFKLIPDEYFSPNGDGLNELWNIKNLEYYLDDNITIHIFDRTGKELQRYDAREFKNLGGWDGRFNGKLLPSTDYWYLITIGTLGEKMTGNFTLKRQ